MPNSLQRRRAAQLVQTLGNDWLYLQFVEAGYSDEEISNISVAKLTQLHHTEIHTGSIIDSDEKRMGIRDAYIRAQS